MVPAMERETPGQPPSFLTRVGMAFRLIFNAEFARQVFAVGLGGEAAGRREGPAVPQIPPERTYAAGLLVLSILQREGRLIDFLQQDVAGYEDAEVGAAARVVHAGCRKVLQQYVSFEPVSKLGEGEPMTVPPGFDAQRIRLTGNVTGQPPFKGTLKHHGWIATEVRLPAVVESLDPRVIAPAEVELS
jgi:hypothetical protein